MRLMIDFDGVLRDSLGDEILDAQPSMLRLKRQKHKLTIFSSRAAHPDLIEAMRSWLDSHKIPYDDITNVKKHADLYIDDKAIHHTSWKDTLSEVESRLG